MTKKKRYNYLLWHDQLLGVVLSVLVKVTCESLCCVPNPSLWESTENQADTMIEMSYSPFIQKQKKAGLKPIVHLSFSNLKQRWHPSTIYELYWDMLILNGYLYDKFVINMSIFPMKAMKCWSHLNLTV